MYDKGNVLRFETTLYEPRDFRVLRKPEGQPQARARWMPLRHSLADLRRRAQVSRAANERPFAAPPLPCPGPLAEDDSRLLTAVSRPEFAQNGCRNRDLRPLLLAVDAHDDAAQKRGSARVSRQLTLLRAHGLIRKVPHTHRYVLTDHGRPAIAALLAARNASALQLASLAA